MTDPDRLVGACHWCHVIGYTDWPGGWPCPDCDPSQDGHRMEAAK